MSETTVTASVGTIAAPDPFRFGWRNVWKKDDNGKPVCVEEPLTFEDVLHPREEDHIMNNTAHDEDVAYLRQALVRLVRHDADARVLSDVRIDWGVEGIQPHGPDLVVFTNARVREGAPVGTYRPKEFGSRPALVIEVTSPSTRTHDLTSKVAEYHRAGVPLYAVVDYLPDFELKEAVILGYRATADGYLRLPLDDRGRLWLEPVRAWLSWEGGRALFYTADNERVLTAAELDQRLQETEARGEELQQSVEEAIAARKEAEREAKHEAELRQKEAELRKQAEDRLAVMEAELKRLRGGPQP